jgi:hypothetical protein
MLWLTRDGARKCLDRSSSSSSNTAASSSVVLLPPTSSIGRSRPAGDISCGVAPARTSSSSRDLSLEPSAPTLFIFHSLPRKSWAFYYYSLITTSLRSSIHDLAAVFRLGSYKHSFTTHRRSFLFFSCLPVPGILWRLHWAKGE